MVTVMIKPEHVPDTLLVFILDSNIEEFFGAIPLEPHHTVRRLIRVHVLRDIILMTGAAGGEHRKNSHQKQVCFHQFQ